MELRRWWSLRDHPGDFPPQPKQVIAMSETHSNLVPFQFEDKNIRVLMIDGNPWWFATDVCAVLEIGNTSDAISRLDPDERQKITDPDAKVSIEGSRINNLVNVVNEPGLYVLILGSRKPEAKVFKRWITHDVLPTLRNQGRYEIPHVAHTKALTIHQAAADQFEQELRVGGLLSAPLHIVQQEAVKVVRHQTGVDWSHYLKYAPAQQEVKPEEVMLEPTEVAARLGFKTAAAANIWI